MVILTWSCLCCLQSVSSVTSVHFLSPCLPPPGQPAQVQPAAHQQRQVPGRALQLPHGGVGRHLPHALLLHLLRHQPGRQPQLAGPARAPLPHPAGVHPAGHLRPVLRPRLQQEEARLLPHLLPGTFWDWYWWGGGGGRSWGKDVDAVSHILLYFTVFLDWSLKVEFFIRALETQSTKSVKQKKIYR